MEERRLSGSEASPILIDVSGQPQVVIFAAQAVYGLNPAMGACSGRMRTTPGRMNNSTPIWGPDNVLIVSSGYNQGTRALRLTRQGEPRTSEELWFTTRLKVMFANALRLGDHLYASHGDFGPAVTTALDVKTGEVAWQERGFGRSSFVYADGKAIVMDEDGDLAMVRCHQGDDGACPDARVRHGVVDGAHSGRERRCMRATAKRSWR